MYVLSCIFFKNVISDRFWVQIISSIGLMRLKFLNLKYRYLLSTFREGEHRLNENKPRLLNICCELNIDTTCSNKIFQWAYSRREFDPRGKPESPRVFRIDSTERFSFFWYNQSLYSQVCIVILCGTREETIKRKFHYPFRAWDVSK